jgi:hypothetical protein
LQIILRKCIQTSDFFVPICFLGQGEEGEGEKRDEARLFWSLHKNHDGKKVIGISNFMIASKRPKEIAMALRKSLNHISQALFRRLAVSIYSVVGIYFSIRSIRPSCDDAGLDQLQPPAAKGWLKN